MEHWLEREIAQWVHHEGSIRRPIAPRANALTTEPHLAHSHKEYGYKTEMRNDTNLEGKLARVVVHPTGMHQRQCVSHRVRIQNQVTCCGTNSAICKCCCRYTKRLAVDFCRAKLNEMSYYKINSLKISFSILGMERIALFNDVFKIFLI